jgi:hypothetical protein
VWEHDQGLNDADFSHGRKDLLVLLAGPHDKLYLLEWQDVCDRHHQPLRIKRDGNLLSHIQALSVI